jgi:hypothetical protein
MQFFCLCFDFSNQHFPLLLASHHSSECNIHIKPIYCIYSKTRWLPPPFAIFSIKKMPTQKLFNFVSTLCPLPVNRMMVLIPTVAQHLLCLSAIQTVIPWLLWDSAWRDSWNTTAVWQLQLYTNYIHARSEVLTPVLMRIHIFWDVTVSKATDARQ